MVTFWNSSLCTRDAAVVNQAVIKTDATICFHDTRSVPRVSIGFGEILCPDEKFKAVTKGTISPMQAQGRRHTSRGLPSRPFIFYLRISEYKTLNTIAPTSNES